MDGDALPSRRWGLTPDLSVQAAHGDFLAKTAGRKEEKVTAVQKPDRPAPGDPGGESC